MSQKNSASTDMPPNEGPATETPGADASAASLPTPDPAALQAELEQAMADAADNKDKYLRAKAEAENVRRRAETEIANARKYAFERFAAEFLAVRDSLELARAVDLQDAGPVAQKVVEGLDLTLKLMDSAFQKCALSAVEPNKGDKFDPEKHQAMSAVESTEVPENHVLSTLQKGYLLHDRLVRPAMVLVAKAPAKEA